MDDLKCVVAIPFGGAKGGITDPSQLSSAEKITGVTPLTD
jgi:glutamate dehydrogenase/leucine dehydrogenase